MKRVARCRICKEPLYELVAFHGLKVGMRQCVNRDCKNYGKAIMKGG